MNRHEQNHPYVINPDAIGDLTQTPLVQHPVAGCPAHCNDWLYRAVRNNRRLSGLPPQDCTCAEEGGEQECPTQAVHTGRRPLDDHHTPTPEAAARAERWRAEATGDYVDDRPSPDEYADLGDV